MVSKAVSNTGPIIHLSEINLLNALEIFSNIKIPEEVAQELRKSKIAIPKGIKIEMISPKWKDMVKLLTNQQDLDLGESSAIALALQEKADYFLTDDLDARNVAKSYLEVHGSIGIILRAFRDKIIDKKTAILKVGEIHSKSSLFITEDLIKQILREINEYSGK